MRKTCYFCLVFVCSLTANAQNEKGDSLLKKLATAKEDTSTVLLYLDLVTFYEHSEPVKAIQYAKKAETLGRKINYTSGIVQAMRDQASSYLVLGKFDSTLYYYKLCLELTRKNNDSLNIGISLFNIGSAYRHKSDFQTALDYSLQGATIIERLGNKRVLAQMNNGLQLLYYYLPNYEMAIVYGKKAVQQARELKDNTLLLMSLSNLSMSYKDLQQLEMSKTVLMEALKLAEETGDVYSQAAILLNLGGVFLEQGDYAMLKEYAQRSLVLNREIASKDGECISLRAMAISNLQEGKYQVAKDYALAAFSIADSNNYKLEKASCLKTLANISFAMQNLKDGEMYFNKSDDLTEEIFKESYLKTAAEYEKKFDSEKKDKQILVQQTLLQKRRTLNYILIGSATTLLIITILSYRNYRQKRKIQEQRLNELEKIKQLTATEAILKGEEQERARLAKDLHDGLGGMMSGIKYSLQTMKQNLIMTSENHQAFERSIDMLDSSINEMRRVAHNMMPEGLIRFGLDAALRDFCNEVDQTGALHVSYQSIGLVNETIGQSTAIIIYRIIQELINNIMKHAVAKSAIVQVSKTNEEISITVEDDGKGFDSSILDKVKGIGWNNIQSRVSYLKGKLDVRSEPGNGTSVHIELIDSGNKV